jgi:desampylase
MSTVVLPLESRRAILAWSTVCAPREACGFLLSRAAGDDDVLAGIVTIVDVTQVSNRSAIDDAFEIDPADVVAADAAARGRGLVIVGMWHSHPRGEAVPSTRDATMGWESALVLIAGLGRERGSGRALRAWRRSGAGFVELRLVARATCAARIAAHNLRP